MGTNQSNYEVWYSCRKKLLNIIHFHFHKDSFIFEINLIIFWYEILNKTYASKFYSISYQSEIQSNPLLWQDATETNITVIRVLNKKKNSLEILSTSNSPHEATLWNETLQKQLYMYVLKVFPLLILCI